VFVPKSAYGMTEERVKTLRVKPHLDALARRGLPRVAIFYNQRGTAGRKVFQIGRSASAFSLRPARKRIDGFHANQTLS
jgi:hypothetical protein